MTGINLPRTARRGSALLVTAICLLSVFFRPVPAFAAANDSETEAAGDASDSASVYDNPLITSYEYTPLNTQEEPSLLNTVNILLLGFDSDYKYYAENGGDSHTDAIMLVSINTETGAVSLISLPRDTLTYVPGIRGIYKLNGAVNAGGGKTDSGFAKAIEAASVLLGNVPIDYYFGIDMEKIQAIGDALGGVDVNVTVSFKTESGKSYSTGMHHLDGEAIYSYMRARKSAEGTDISRTKRQRAVIAALIQKVKDENLYFRIPQILLTLHDGMYTNFTLGVVERLMPAVLAMNTDDIAQYIVEGNLYTALNGWNLYFIDQDARAELMTNVFGIDADPVKYCSYDYCEWLIGNGGTWSGGMSVLRYLYDADQVTVYANSLTDTARQISSTVAGVEELCDRMKALFCETADAVDQLQGKYTSSSEVKTLDDQVEALKKELRSSVIELAGITGFPGDSGLDQLGYGDMRWIYKTRWETDPAINEIYVNFR